MLLCFLLPFMVVKCNDNKMITASWINFLWIWEPKNHLDKSMWWEKNSEISTEKKVYFSIILLFLVVILGLGFSAKNLFDEKNWKNIDFSKFDRIYFSANALIILFLVMFTFDIKMNLLKQEFEWKNERQSEKIKEMIIVETWSWVTFIFLIAILNILYFWNELNYFEKIKEKINKKREEKNISEKEEKVEENKKEEKISEENGEIEKK